MAYNVEIIKKSQYKTSEWSGGSTTELYIYPKYSRYSECDFKWRLSSAKVEAEESTFTSLPGIYRIIMIIEGQLKLEHKGHHEVTLRAFEQDSFAGNWTTKSFGKVTDFNLMMTSECSGNLEVISVKGGEFRDILLCNKMDNGEKYLQITEAFYLVEGDVEIITETYKKINLKEGELVVVTATDKESTSVLRFSNCMDKPIKVIRTSIFYSE